jgi:hypothetical protein
MLSGLFNRLQRVVPFATRVVDEIVYEETKILKELMPRMYEVMYNVAKMSCDYVKRGRWSSCRFRFDKSLMISARTISGPAYPEMIEKMDTELSEMIEDFDRAMNVESFLLSNETSKLLFS